MPLPLNWQDQEAQTNLAAIQGQQGLPVAQLVETAPPTGANVVDQLLGIDGQERYQLWPEKLIRDALSAPHDVLNSKTPLTSQDLIKPALDMSAVAGTGGLGGVGEGAGTALGAGPFLRPALKYEGKIYKAPMGGEHMDAIPKDLQPEFTQQAMSGEDISNFNFGFMNHKGQFLDREKAMDYAIKEGLLSPHDAKYGALTSTLMADSSKEAVAIDLVSKHHQNEINRIIEEMQKLPEGPEGDAAYDELNNVLGQHKDRLEQIKNGKE